LYLIMVHVIHVLCLLTYFLLFREIFYLLILLRFNILYWAGLLNGNVSCCREIPNSNSYRGSVGLIIFRGFLSTAKEMLR
jgi:hypothetical protein